jgi:hypothetical protein
LIELSRVLLRQFRAVLRKSVLAADPRGPCPTVLCRSGHNGLSVSCVQGGAGIRHHKPGSLAIDSVAFPASLLRDLENAGETITLEQVAPFKGKASWNAGDGPHVIDFDTADPASLPSIPEVTRGMVNLEPGFLTVLDDAARTASRDAGRYACNHVLLRGKDGSVIATDGKQLLVQNGFPLPWSDDRFLPALPVFGCRELPHDVPVRVGLEKDRLSLEVGPWLLIVKAEVAARYPEVDRVIPGLAAIKTRFRLDAQDANELMRALPRLPVDDDQQRPVTLDLGGKVVVRARDEKGHVEEILLPRSQVDGPPMQVVMDRRYLLRVLQLGFTEILIESAEKPLLCKDAKRTFVWMPLSETNAVTSTRPTRKPATSPEPPPRTTDMPTNNDPRDQEQRNGSDPHPIADPVAEAEAVRLQLQEALARTSRLIAALKQQRRQGRIVQTALDSLRRLQNRDR